MLKQILVLLFKIKTTMQQQINLWNIIFLNPAYGRISQTMRMERPILFWVYIYTDTVYPSIHFIGTSSAMLYIVLHSSKITVWCSALGCFTLQFTTVICIALVNTALYGSSFNYTALFCDALYCTALYWSSLKWAFLCCMVLDWYVSSIG